MRRIKGGLLITDITDQMVKKQRGEISQNIFIYSAHDATLVNMLRGLNVMDQMHMLPEYGASLVFELHCDDEQPSQHPQCIVKVSQPEPRQRSDYLHNVFISSRFFTIRAAMTKIRNC